MPFRKLLSSFVMCPTLGAHVVDPARECLENRTHRLESLLGVIRHDRERTLLGRGGAAGDARVDEGDAPPVELAWTRALELGAAVLSS